MHGSMFDMYMSYGWGYTGQNVTSERKKKPCICHIAIRHIHGTT